MHRHGNADEVLNRLPWNFHLVVSGVGWGRSRHVLGIVRLCPAMFGWLWLMWICYKRKILVNDFTDLEKKNTVAWLAKRQPNIRAASAGLGIREFPDMLAAKTKEPQEQCPVSGPHKPCSGALVVPAPPKSRSQLCHAIEWSRCSRPVCSPPRSRWPPARDVASSADGGQGRASAKDRSDVRLAVVA